MDSFLVFEPLIENPFLLKSWVSIGGLSYHLPILLKTMMEDSKSLSILMFNHAWILKEYYKNIIEEL